jgi:hypothetical protein
MKRISSKPANATLTWNLAHQLMVMNDAGRPHERGGPMLTGRWLWVPGGRGKLCNGSVWRVTRGQKRFEDARRRAYDPRVHHSSPNFAKRWIAGSSPAMTALSMRLFAGMTVRYPTGTEIAIPRASRPKEQPTKPSKDVADFDRAISQPIANQAHVRRSSSATTKAQSQR